MTRTTRGRRAVLGSAAATAAGLALVVGAAGAGQAAPLTGAAKAAPACGAAARTTAPAGTVRTAATTTEAPAATVAAATGKAADRISYALAAEAPLGLWSSSGVTLRTPVAKGTVRLDVTTRGFDSDSLVIQRYVPTSHRWVDLNTKPSSGNHRDKGVFTFPVTAAASAAHPATVALRVQDLDRPGKLTVAASVADGHGHTYRAPARTAVVDRPTTTVGGWPRGTALVRGGAAKEFSITVRNTTKRAYPGLTAGYFAYGAAGGHALLPKDVVLQEYLPGHGWKRVAMVPDGCDPGMSAALAPVNRGPLAPGATAVYRLRLAIARTAPAADVEAGISVGTSDHSFYFQMLRFPIRTK
ncbi:hypothetical protein [Streptantibioticus cattleyicolor]|nr:hypothetical protein [Streptantibioticus cattleyicolor]CCB71663.1 exported protein of unknown function [Streptantibioticus cattleyicolor NRRL 8057 = DSM 46488]